MSNVIPFPSLKIKKYGGSKVVDFYQKYEDVFKEEWVEFEGAKFKLRSREHPRVITASVQYQSIADEKDIIEYLAKIYSEAIVVDWEKVEIAGEDQPFTVAGAYKLFKDIPAITLFLFNRYKAADPIDIGEEEKKS